MDEAGVAPGLVVASSVGAVNGAWVAGQGDLGKLGDVWRSLRRGAVFPTHPVGGLLGFLGRSDHLVSDSGLRHLLHTHLRFDRLEDAAVPLHVVATDLLTGDDVRLLTGDAAEAILTSPILVSPTDFSQADHLIRRGHAHTRAWLQDGGGSASVSVLTVDPVSQGYRRGNGQHRDHRAH